MNNSHSDIQAIHDRNARVEADKAWETSWTRRLILAAMTYIVAAVFLWNMYAPDFLLQALIPTGGFLLSTLSLPWCKKQWIAHHSAHL